MIDSVVLATSNEYAAFAAITLKSLRMHIDRALSVYLIGNCLTQDSKSVLSKAWDSDIHFIEVQDIVKGVEEKGCMVGGYPAMTVARWLAVDILPEDIKTVLFLDADLLITDDLNDLIDGSYSDHSMYGVIELMSNESMASVSLDPYNPYLNVGVIVLNMTKIRQSGFSRQLLEVLEAHPGVFRICDQDAINYLQASEVGILDASYNVLPPFFYFSYMDYKEFVSPFNCPFYSRDVYENAVSNPAIVHFAGSFCFTKPWYRNCKHPYRDSYRRIMREHGIDFVGQDHRRLRSRFMSSAYPVLPRLMKPILKDVWCRYRKLKENGPLRYRKAV